MIACASRPSRRSSQDTCEPMPGTSPNARTSNTPPSDSFAFRAASISATIASLAAASRQRTGDSSTPSKSAARESTRAAGRGHRADARHVRAHLHPELAQERLGERRRRPRARRSRAPTRARARCGRRCGRTSGCRRGRRGRGAGGGPRPPRRPPATGSSAPPSSGSRGSRSACATGLPSVRPWRTPAVTSARSFSIFMRPPRPCPSWRRARSRSMSSGRSSSPAGQALDDGGEARTVGLARCYEAQRHGAHTLLMRVRAPGWRRNCWEELLEGLVVRGRCASSGSARRG